MLWTLAPAVHEHASLGAPSAHARRGSQHDVTKGNLYKLIFQPVRQASAGADRRGGCATRLAQGAAWEAKTCFSAKLIAGAVARRIPDHPTNLGKLCRADW